MERGGIVGCEIGFGFVGGEVLGGEVSLYVYHRIVGKVGHRMDGGPASRLTRAGVNAPIIK